MLALHRNPTGRLRLMTGLLALGLFATGAVNAADSNAEDYDFEGKAVAHGDFNGDGYEDLALGAEGEDYGGMPDVGAVDVIYGGSAGLDRNHREFWNVETAGVEGTAHEHDMFGSAVSAADFNADGYDD